MGPDIVMKVRHEEQNPKQWQHLKSICAKGHQLERKFGGQQKKNYQEGVMPEAKEISLTMKREWSACQIPQR